MTQLNSSQVDIQLNAMKDYNSLKSRVNLIILITTIVSLFFGLVIGSYLTVSAIAKIANAIDIDSINIVINETKATQEVLSFMNNSGIIEMMKANLNNSNYSNEERGTDGLRID
jgi:hypothetical protein